MANKDQFDIRQIQHKKEVRVFTHALHDDGFCNKVKITESILTHLETICSPLSKLSLMHLISAYFKHYDNMVSAGNREVFCRFVVKCLQAYFEEKSHLPRSNLARIYQHRSLLFNKNPPVLIVQKAKKEQKNLDEVLNEIGMKAHRQGLLAKRVYAAYYIETLKKIPVGEDDPILVEVTKKAVYMVDFDGKGKLLGHRILTILIDRSIDDGLSDCWREVIMKIAGDPRVPKTAHNYQQWWQILGEKRIQQMQMWLNRFNLQLFLSILEQGLIDQGNDGQRMFEARKDFIMGLDDQKFIRNSRLFLTEDALSYLRENHQGKQLPSLAKVKGAAKDSASVIYLELINGQHIIEGTHNFKIKLMNQLPQAFHIMDYGKQIFEDKHFREELVRQYKREFGNHGIWAERHDTGFKWFHRITLEIKKHNLSLDIRKMLSPENYKFVRNKFGVW